MPALFLRHFNQQEGALTLSRSVAGTDRSRCISKGDLRDIVDRSRYIPIDAERYFRGSDEIDGKSDGKMLVAEKTSIYDNWLEVPLMIEWE